MSSMEERALADSDDADRFAGTQRDTLTSFIKTSGELVKVTAERGEARAALADVRARNERQRVTLAKIRALCRLADGMGVDVPASDLRAALEPTP